MVSLWLVMIMVLFVALLTVLAIQVRSRRNNRKLFASIVSVSAVADAIILLFT